MKYIEKQGVACHNASRKANINAGNAESFGTSIGLRKPPVPLDLFRKSICLQKRIPKATCMHWMIATHCNFMFCNFSGGVDEASFFTNLILLSLLSGGLPGPN